MSKKILMSVGLNEKRVAIIENGQLQEFYVEQEGTDQLAGSIFKGRVRAVIPGIEAAFVNIGLVKDGFLYVADAMAPAILEQLEEEDQIARPSNAKITDLVKRNQEILVQIVKEPLGTKGARLTTHVTLPGRYGVLLPTQPHRGVSRRIALESERRRLRHLIDELKLPKGVGLIIRTAGQGKSKEDLERDVRNLLGLWGRIQQKDRKVKSPALVHPEFDLAYRALRDHLADDVDELWCDDQGEFQRLQRLAHNLAPDFRNRIKCYTQPKSLFEHHGADREIEKIFQRKVSLKSGGTIVIEQTEGLVAIDVNTGRFTGTTNLEETVFKNNCEAALEIARQVRLRDLGGIIIIDFIDMEQESNRNKVFSVFRDALRRDRSKTNILRLSEIGLVEMTRQRQRPSLEGTLLEECSHCVGTGRIKTLATVAAQLYRDIRQATVGKRTGQVIVRMHPDLKRHLADPKQSLWKSMQRRLRMRVDMVEDVQLPREEFKIQVGPESTQERGRIFARFRQT